MTTSNDPDQIRADIAATRAELSDNVDSLTDTANPKNVAHRQVDKMKDSLQGGLNKVKEQVMGSDESSSDARSGDLAGTARDNAAAVGDAVSAAPERAKEKTRGNPLAAGLIAFGAGLLISGLIPSSQKEQQLVSELQDKHLEPLKTKASEVGQEMADNLREPAQQAAESVRSTATDAVQNVKDEGIAAKDEVQGQAETSKDTVQDARSN